MLAVAGLAALFVVFGLFRPGVKGGGCGNCSCEGDACQQKDDLAAGPGPV